MASLQLHVFISLLVATAMLAKASAFKMDELHLDDVVVDGDGRLNVSRTMTCDRSIGECNEEEAAPVGMSLDGSRQLMAKRRRRYISYIAIKKDRVPCGQRGASYYDCYGHTQVNPYRRQCTIITQCARILS